MLDSACMRPSERASSVYVFLWSSVELLPMLSGVDKSDQQTT